jgi:hypothetical protein
MVGEQALGAVPRDEVVGIGVPSSRRRASLARRSAMIWFSSTGGASSAGWSGVCAAVI